MRMTEGNGHAQLSTWPRTAEDRLAAVQRDEHGHAVLKPSDYLRPMSAEQEAAELAKVKTRGGSAPIVTPPGWALASAGGGARPKASGYNLALTLTAGALTLPTILDFVAAREQEALAEVANAIDACPAAAGLARARARLEELRAGAAGARTQLAEAEGALNDADADLVKRLGRKRAAANEELGAFRGPLAAAEAKVAELAAALTAFASATLSRTRMALCAETTAALPGHNRPTPIPADLPAGEWLLGLARACELGRRTAAQTWGGYFLRQALAKHVPPPPEQVVGRLTTMAEALRRRAPEAVEQLRPASP
jgi:hypothetical protein